MAEKNEKKPKKMEPHTAEWERQANRLARDFVGTMKACRDCGGPVISGYCCTRCGSSNP